MIPINPNPAEIFSHLIHREGVITIISIHRSHSRTNKKANDQVMKEYKLQIQISDI